MNIDQILRRELTPQQYSAAVAPEQEVRALASAGSGKSRVLAYRTARLLASGEPADSIVAFTFTRKAAESIKSRVADALLRSGQDPLLVGAMYIGTIHEWCKGVMGDIDARYRQFDVLDDMGLRLYLISRYGRLAIHEVRDTKPTKNGYPRGYFETLDKMAGAWQMMNDELLDPVQVVASAPELAQSLERMREELEKDHFIDFSLMQRLVVERLDAGDSGALRALESLRHVLVDEYQDVNPIQDRLITLMHQNSDTLFVVGDDDQAIYGWRGADVTNILEFQNRYPTASTHPLGVNFRSTSAIVQTADAFAAAELGAVRLVKNPVAHADHDPREFGVAFFDRRTEEAEWVADRIEQLLGSGYEDEDGVRGLTPGDFAILMQSVNTEEADGAKRHAAFTAALEARGIPYTVNAGGGLFDRAQPAALRSALELLRESSPNRNQVDALVATELLPAFPKLSQDRVRRVFADWGRKIHVPDTSAGGARQRLFPQQLLHDMLEALNLAESGFDPGVMADLGTFSRIMKDVETVFFSVDTKARFAAVLNFLGNVASGGYETNSDMMSRPDAVSVLTVHKAKGLEFPAVFVVDVEQGRFPRNQKKYDGWLPEKLIQRALDAGSYQTGAPDQARLFYTAITRAERYLYVTGSALLPGGRQVKKTSKFANRLVHPEIRRDLTTAGAPPAVRPSPAAPRRRGDASVLPTTYSQIHNYLSCPYDYLLREVYGFAPPVPELFGFGRAVHAAVGKLHQQFPDTAPTAAESRDVAEDMFHLKHVAPSADPVNRPGAYERAKNKAADIVSTYSTDYATDFEHERQVEWPFEIPVGAGVITGAIDLLLHLDPAGEVQDSSVIDFKTMEGGPNPVANARLHWEDLALQVQLYARGAEKVRGTNTATGAVHLLKDSQRIRVPVDDQAIDAAVANVEWAVDRVIAGDFPMRPAPDKCADCDFSALCPKRAETFAISARPPALHLPDEDGGTRLQHAAAIADGEDLP